MKFQANSRRRAKEYEADVLARWKAEKTFEQSVENREYPNPNGVQLACRASFGSAERRLSQLN